MKISGAMSGQNDMLNSVMAARESATGSSYAEMTMLGRRTATNMQQAQQGKDAVKEMKLNIKEDEQSIEEATDNALAKKKELDKAEAQRLASKLEGESNSGVLRVPRGDSVEISKEGIVAAKNITVAVTPVISEANVESSSSASATGNNSVPASPAPEQTDVTV